MIILFWIVNVVLSAILWRIGGSKYYPKSVRRVGVPVTTWLFHSAYTVLFFGWTALANTWITIFSIPLCISAYGRGYGIPQHLGVGADSGSHLAQFICKLLGYKKYTNGIYIVENKFKLEVILRTVIGFFYGFALILYAVTSGNYLVWGIQLAVCTIGVPFVALAFTNDVKEERGIGAVSNFLTQFIR